eukprot:4856529-Pyramimonas_sp.AAC.1
MRCGRSLPGRWRNYNVHQWWTLHPTGSADYCPNLHLLVTQVECKVYFTCLQTLRVCSTRYELKRKWDSVVGSGCDQGSLDSAWCDSKGPVTTKA